MKLIWKFFFSIMTVTQLCISIGGFYLIQSQFMDSLRIKQKESVIENDTLYYLFKDSINEVIELNLNDENKIKRVLSKSFTNSDINDMMFTVVYNGLPIFMNNLEKEFINESGYGYEDEYSTITKVVHYNDSWYIQSSTYIEKNDMYYYIKNYINVDNLFINKDKQLRVLKDLIIIEFIISGAVILVLSYRLSKPIEKLSFATKKLAKQEYDVDIPINRYDEIGSLARDFVDMSKQIESHIKELKEVNQSQETFINNFTHELKTPLTSIIGYADRLRSKKLDEEEIVLSANYIVNEGKRIESISKKLMQMIILKNDYFSFYPIYTLVFFDSILDIMKPIFRNIEMDIEEGYIYIEPDLMKNAIVNIIDNSIHACNQDGLIRIKGYKHENYYRVIIEDNGKGISKEDIIRIQEPFYMADKSRTRLHGGSGLGLALVKSIIDLHNGNIYFESELGKGTRVKIDIKGEIRHD